MPRLLSKSTDGQRIEKWWLHTGDDGNDAITVETIEDVEPIFERVRRQRDMREYSPVKSEFRHVASIPPTVIEEVCRIKGKEWGLPTREVYSQLMQGKTSWAKGAWRMLTQGRDYRKFQSKA